MESNEGVVLSAANLDIIENNLKQLAQHIGDVSLNIEGMDNKVNEVTDSVRLIEEEIKNFMIEIRGTTIVSNAKQSIMMSQDELNKKYGHYDSVRRKINGILGAMDINAIRKNTAQSISEQVIVDTPNYWLAPALVSLCAWITDDKELANRALKEAMTLDDEKTSLLFCLIHIRAHRYETATKWLRRYLEMQDPTKMENKIITVLDAITNGSLGVEARGLCLEKIDEWSKELMLNPGYRDVQVERWTDYIYSIIPDYDDNDFYYIKEYTVDYERLKKMLAISFAGKTILNELQNIIMENEPDIPMTSEVDRLINMLVFNYENEELDLKKDIAKNKLIVEENGNVKVANERFKATELAYKENADFYTWLTNIVTQDKNVKPTINTRKMAMALSKDWIMAAYDNITHDIDNNINVNIKIDNWQGLTTNGQNEKELIQNLYDHIDNDTHNEVYGKKLFDFKIGLVTLAGIILTILTFSIPISSIVIFAGTLIFDAYMFYVNFMDRHNKIKIREERKKKSKEILLNTLAEIVDVHFICKDNKNIHNQTKMFLNSLDYRSYIKTIDNGRNIQVGGKNE